MEIEINSDDHKISNNKLRCYFNDITKFDNNKVALTECMFRTYFENIKSNYLMKIKKGYGFYFYLYFYNNEIYNDDKMEYLKKILFNNKKIKFNIFSYNI